MYLHTDLVGGERGIPLRLQMDTSTLCSTEGSTGNMTSGDEGRERLVERSVTGVPSQLVISPKLACFDGSTCNFAPLVGIVWEY